MFSLVFLPCSLHSSDLVKFFNFLAALAVHYSPNRRAQLTRRSHQKKQLPSVSVYRGDCTRIYTIYTGNTSLFAVTIVVIGLNRQPFAELRAVLRTFLRRAEVSTHRSVIDIRSINNLSSFLFTGSVCVVIE